MVHFVTQNGSQQARDIFLLAEAQGSDEHFTNFHRVFGPVSCDISTLVEHGIVIGGIKYEGMMFFVAYFKVLYHAREFQAVPVTIPALVVMQQSEAWT